MYLSSVTLSVIVAVCGTPGDGEGSGVTGTIVIVPVPSAAGWVTFRLLTKLFGTRLGLEEVAITLRLLHTGAVTART